MGNAEHGGPGDAAARQDTRAPRTGFPKSARLRKRREFLAVQATGKRFQGRYFLAVVTRRVASEQNPGRGRVGITVTKKIGNAVTRNRIKRMVRQYVRTSEWLTRPMDSVIIARRGADGLGHQDLVDRDLDRILHLIDKGAHGSTRRRRTRRGRPPC